MPATHRRRPIEVEARQFDGQVTDELEIWLGPSYVCRTPALRTMTVLVGGLEPTTQRTVRPTDWVVKRAAGIVDVCTAVQFDQLHEAVEG